MNISLKCMSAGLLAAGMAGLTACNQANTKSTVTTDSAKTLTYALPDSAGFQTTVEGKKTNLYILKNKKGMQAAMTNFGGRLVSLMVPDKSGKMIDVVEGFDSVKGYQA